MKAWTEAELAALPENGCLEELVQGFRARDFVSGKSLPPRLPALCGEERGLVLSRRGHTTRE